MQILLDESFRFPVLLNVPRITILAKQGAFQFLGFLCALAESEPKIEPLSLCEQIAGLHAYVASAAKSILDAISVEVVEQPLSQIGRHAEVEHFEGPFFALYAANFVNASLSVWDLSNFFFFETGKHPIVEIRFQFVCGVLPPYSGVVAIPLAWIALDERLVVAVRRFFAVDAVVAPPMAALAEHEGERPFLFCSGLMGFCGWIGVTHCS
jgi:hypothetical protein